METIIKPLVVAVGKSNINSQNIIGIIVFGVLILTLIELKKEI